MRLLKRPFRRLDMDLDCTSTDALVGATAMGALSPLTTLFLLTDAVYVFADP